MQLAEFICSHHEAILVEWEAFARTLMPAAEGMDSVGLRDHADEILHAIVADMESLQNAAESKLKGEGGKATEGEAEAAHRPLGAIGQLHAVLRIENGFTLSQVLAEYRALRASIFRLWETRPDPIGVMRFNEAIDEALTEAVDRFTEKTNHSRDRIIGIVSHDLRNPLNGILMGASMLASGEGIDDKSARIASRIQNSAMRMNRIVGDLIDLTCARFGAPISIVRRPMNLGTVCRLVISELEGSHPTAVMRYTATGDLRGDWDSDRLAQVLSNLLGNALQHGDVEQPISVTASGEDAMVVVAVRNAGPRIPKNALREIFDPMVRNVQNHAADRGLGLGLYIAKELVTAHGGTIGVTSTAVAGTTFTVKLPREAGASVTGR